MCLSVFDAGRDARAFVSGLEVRALVLDKDQPIKGYMRMETQVPALLNMLSLQLSAARIHGGSACTRAAPAEQDTCFLRAEKLRT